MAMVEGRKITVPGPPGYETCAASSRPGSSGAEQLVGYVSLAPSVTPLDVGKPQGSFAFLGPAAQMADQVLDDPVGLVFFQ